VQLGIRARQILRVGAYVLIGLLTFVFALQLTFPYERVKDRIVDALADKYDVTIGDVSRGFFPGSMTLSAVSLRSRRVKPDDPITVINIDKLEVRPSLLSILHGKISVDFDAKLGVGELSGNIAGPLSTALSGAFTPTHVAFVGRDVPGGSLPIKDALGLPIIGKLDVDAELDLVYEKAARSNKRSIDWTKVTGDIEFDCPSACTIGDGKTKLKPKIKNARNAAFAADGIDFGEVNIDTLAAHVAIKDGKLDVTKWEAKSGDGELHVEADVALQPELLESNISGCLRFKGSEALLKREPKTYAAIQTTGAPLAPDGLYHIRLDGKLRDVRRLGQVCTGTPDASEHEPKRISIQHDRPEIRIQPNQPTGATTPAVGVVTPTSVAEPPPPPPPIAGAQEEHPNFGSATANVVAPGSAGSGSSEASGPGSSEGSGSAEGSGSDQPLR
jgi:type II secretion system protein N